MDILRKELDAFYASQRIDGEDADPAVADAYRHWAEDSVRVSNGCKVITDAACDRCLVYAGTLGRLTGLSDDALSFFDFASSDEDMIYSRIHPEDLVEKRMLEYDFFRHVDSLADGNKLLPRAMCRLRLLDRNGKYVAVDNSTQILSLTPLGKVRLILCCYDLAPGPEPADGISPRILDAGTGRIVSLDYSTNRHKVLTGREKQILLLISEGLLSKEIAHKLGISVHTVNRHRQNILEKLSVDNSMEAVMAARAMSLL